MSVDSSTWDYVFVSDLHLSLGYGPDRRAYHPREDFFFDDAFFRWVRWLHANRAPDRRWEMVLVGDAFDFLPADEKTVGEYLRERARRNTTAGQASGGKPSEEGPSFGGPYAGPARGSQAIQYWETHFSNQMPSGRVPTRIQRLMFEDDVIEGNIRLEIAPTGARKSPTRPPARVPPWAVEIFWRHNPSVLASLQMDGVEWRLGRPVARSVGTDGSARGLGQSTRAAETLKPVGPQTRAGHEDFERRYGFLPTPEKSAQKLEAIYRGHPVFFRALAWFIGLGHRVVFVRGNHDLELYWPAVQKRLRQCVAREYSAAFHDPDGYSPESRSVPDLADRIRFEPGWFCYRRGAFYAEHGCQYDMFSGSANPVRPLLPGSPWMMNPDVGSLAVLCLHNHLESEFPELENEADYGASLIELVRRDPVRMTAMLVRHAGDFVRMAQRLWLAGRAATSEQVPSDHDMAQCAGPAGLTPALAWSIYDLGARPLLLRKRLAWLLFSPAGHVVKVGLLVLAALVLAGLAVLYYLVIAPAIASLIPASLFVTSAGPTLRLLGKALLWIVPPAAYRALRRRLQRQSADDPLFAASAKIHAFLQQRDPDLNHFIMGHSHRTDVRPITLRSDGRHAYYTNTGTWTPTFAEGRRRLQTLGREVEFTFVRLVRGIRGYESALLRWNDAAGRADPQMVPPDSP